jgi:hypothetical protein
LNLRAARSNVRSIARTSITSIIRESNMLNNQGPWNLMADLTWADLYARQIRKDLRQLTPAIRRVSNSTELVDSTAKLREQLEGAHRTIAELRTIAAPDSRRPNSK